MHESRGIIYSSTLHGIILLLLIFGLPDFFHHQVDMEEPAITVDILPIAPISNVKPVPDSPPPEPDQKKISDKNTSRKSAPATKKVETKQEEKVEPIPSKDAIKKADKKKEKKKPEKKQEDDLSKIFESVKNQAKTDESKVPTQQKPQQAPHPATSPHYDSSLPLSLNELDAIRSQFKTCWTMPVGAKDPASLIVTLHLELSQDGTVTEVKLVKDEGRYNSDSFFRAAADAAIRAVNMCSPLKNLSPEKYGTWHSIEMTFNPKNMAY